jgi:hypothetical protein
MYIWERMGEGFAQEGAGEEGGERDRESENSKSGRGIAMSSVAGQCVCVLLSCPNVSTRLKPGGTSALVRRWRVCSRVLVFRNGAG